MRRKVSELFTILAVLGVAALYSVMPASAHGGEIEPPITSCLPSADGEGCGDEQAIYDKLDAPVQDGRDPMDYAIALLVAGSFAVAGVGTVKILRDRKSGQSE